MKCLELIGNSYLNKNEYESAKRYFVERLEFIDKKLTNNAKRDKWLSSVHYDIGEVYNEKADSLTGENNKQEQNETYWDAFNSFKTSLQHQMNYNGQEENVKKTKSMLARITTKLGDVATKLRRYQDANSYYIKALTHNIDFLRDGDNSEIPFVISSLSMIAGVLKDMAKTELSSEYYDIAIRISIYHYGNFHKATERLFYVAKKRRDEIDLDDLYEDDDENEKEKRKRDINRFLNKIENLNMQNMNVYNDET